MLFPTFSQLFWPMLCYPYERPTNLLEHRIAEYNALYKRMRGEYYESIMLVWQGRYTLRDRS